MNLNVIKKPLVTEKNTAQAQFGVYAFEVDRKSNKYQIKSAVEKAFQVKVVDVKTMVCRNRSRKTGTKFSKVRYWKKAFVKLSPGDKISIFEGV